MLSEQFCQMLTPGNDLPCKHYIRPDETGQPGLCAQSTNFFCTEAMKKRLPSISYSRATDFIHCKLRYKHGVIEGLRVKDEMLPEAMKLGKAWDLIMRNKYDFPQYPDMRPYIDNLAFTPDQAAKINALNRAFTDLEILINKDSLLGGQYKVTTQILNNNLVGFVDRAYEDHIIETKLSARPDFYTQKENVAYQLGTYFLTNESWEYAVVEIARVPSLKLKDGESPEAYEQRIYGDVISRPAHYFLGWDRKTRTFGTRFFRSEFDLEEIHSTFCHVLHEIQDAVTRGAWYPNNLACHVPAPCPYLPIKRSGVVSEEIYERRTKKGGDDDGTVRDV
jgi:hypothetical protein